MLSIEAFIAANLLMNIIVLGVSARCTGHIRWRRVLLTAAVGTGYAVAAYNWWEASWLRSAAAQIVCLLIMSMILFGYRFRTNRWTSLFYLMGSMLFAGGIMALLDRWLEGPLLFLIGWICIGTAVFARDFLREGQQIMRYKVCVRVSTRMGSVVLSAFVDTGNRLTEPLSGLPVLIVRAAALKRIIDSSCLYPTQKRLPPGFRIIRYDVLGGEGKMWCFKPESVCIRGLKGWDEAPDVWIAIYPGELPNAIEALAPPVFGQVPDNIHRRIRSEEGWMM